MRCLRREAVEASEAVVESEAFDSTPSPVLPAPEPALVPAPRRPPRLAKIPGVVEDGVLRVSGKRWTCEDVERCELGEWHLLYKVFLGKNPLVSLPPSLLHATRLVELSVFACELSSLPDLSALQRLQRLYVHENPLKSLPTLHWDSLRVLNGSKTGLSEIPVALKGLTNLESLTLNGNEIAVIPRWLATVTNLVSLSLFANRIWHIPWELQALVKLDELFLRENRLPPPMNRNLVTGRAIALFLGRDVQVYEAYLTMYMCWMRLRREAADVLTIGSLPREILSFIANQVYLGYPPSSVDDVDRRRVFEAVPERFLLKNNQLV